MNPLISIIIPVYRVEQYLVQCLNSILNQTYKNLEIIIVDDGSPDNCPAICDEYAKKDQRIKVIHQNNAGLSAARNAGIGVARSEYIAFVDSDDCIHERMIEILYKNISKNKADISVCDFSKVTDLGHKDKPIGQEKITIFNNLEAMKNLYSRKWYLRTVVAWNKLYRKEIFQTIRYPAGKVHEDEFVIHHILETCKKIVYSDAPLYYYLQRDTGIMGQPYNLHKLDKIEAFKERMLFFLKKGYGHLYALAYKQYLDILIAQYRLVRKHYPQEKGIRGQLRNDFMDSYLNGSVALPLKNRARYKLFSFWSFLDTLTLKIWHL